jgi:hypothetical protein
MVGVARFIDAVATAFLRRTRTKTQTTRKRKGDEGRRAAKSRRKQQ